MLKTTNHFTQFLIYFNTFVNLMGSNINPLKTKRICII